MPAVPIWAWVVLGAVLLLGIGGGGFRLGSEIKQAQWDREKLVAADHIVRVDKIIQVEVPKIVTRVVTKTVTVEKEVSHVQAVVNENIPADCILPDKFGMLLVAAARGIDPDSPAAAAISGAYGCREVLDATLRDLKAGYKNTATLEGLVAYVTTLNSAEKEMK